MAIARITGAGMVALPSGKTVMSEPEGGYLATSTVWSSTGWSGIMVKSIALTAMVDIDEELAVRLVVDYPAYS